jgi:hypothetical protein
MDWQPIETVPIGRSVLLWDAAYKMVVLQLARKPLWRGHTHWMPLPAPPQEPRDA